MDDLTRYRDPERARVALATLARNRDTIESWRLTLGQLAKVAVHLAHPYVSAEGPDGAQRYYDGLSGGDPDKLTGDDAENFREDVLGTLSWQMVGPSGSDRQRVLSKMLAWRPGWAEERNEQLRENHRRDLLRGMEG